VKNLQIGSDVKISGTSAYGRVTAVRVKNKKVEYQVELQTKVAIHWYTEKSLEPVPEYSLDIE
jgi:hypothetical protein